MQIVSFAAGRNRDQGRDGLFIEAFYKGCIGCGIHQSMTYRCHSLRPPVLCSHGRRRPTHTDTHNQRSGGGRRRNQSCSRVFDAPLSPGEACISTQLWLPLCQINKSALKLKGIQPPSPSHHHLQPFCQMSSKLLQESFIFFLFHHSTWLRALVLTPLMK